jgi:hypothetical protein
VLRHTGTNRYEVQHLATEFVMDIHLEDLKPFTGSPETALEAASLDTTIDKEYLVDSIVAHKFVGKPHNLASIRFKIRWHGWGPKFDTWVKYPTVEELEALDHYVDNHAYLSRIVPVVTSESGAARTPQPAFKRGGVAALPIPAPTATDSRAKENPQSHDILPKRRLRSSATNE